MAHVLSFVKNVNDVTGDSLGYSLSIFSRLLLLYREMIKLSLGCETYHIMDIFNHMYKYKTKSSLSRQLVQLKVKGKLQLNNTYKYKYE